ncbi:DMT family transporter [Actinosynnema sp. NPDC050436]|uniref:DMT family transporter n=1 Tax=Actinosynnema sp. NPDC050436 TaxID=3155659 RepID=UPI0033C90A69
MRRPWVGKFVLLSAIWGGSFALIKVAVDAGVPAVWVAFARCLFGALALWAFCAVQRQGVPRDRAVWGHALVVAALLNAVPFTLLAYGETKVSSVLAGVFNATTPLTTLVFVLLIVPQEKVTGAKLAGLLVGFTGVLVVLGVWQGLGDDVLVGSAACLGATTCYGAGFAYTRRFFSGGPHSAGALSAVQITCGAAQLAVAAPLLGGVPAWPGWPAAAALVVLGAAGTGLAYVLNLDVIRQAGPTVAATVTYVTPLWSTALGVLFLAEPAGWNAVAGGVIVVAGVLLARKPANRPVGQERTQPLVRADKPGPGRRAYGSPHTTTRSRQ